MNGHSHNLYVIVHNKIDTISKITPPTVQSTTPLTHNDTHTMATNITLKLLYLTEQQQTKKSQQRMTAKERKIQQQEYTKLMQQLQAPDPVYKHNTHQFHTTQNTNTTQIESYTNNSQLWIRNAQAPHSTNVNQP